MTQSLIVHPERTVVMALTGVLFGLLYFAALRHSVTMFVGGKRRLGPLSLTLVRVAGAVGFLLVAANLGAAPLLGGFVGFLIARALALRARSGPPG
jgi:N-ATPase, AtpR subunit